MEGNRDANLSAATKNSRCFLGRNAVCFREPDMEHSCSCRCCRCRLESGLTKRQIYWRSASQPLGLRSLVRLCLLLGAASMALRRIEAESSIDMLLQNLNSWPHLHLGSLSSGHSNSFHTRKLVDLELLDLGTVSAARIKARRRTPLLRPCRVYRKGSPTRSRGMNASTKGKAEFEVEAETEGEYLKPRERNIVATRTNPRLTRCDSETAQSSGRLQSYDAFI